MLFLGLLYERTEERLIASKSRNGVLQNQVNAFQWNCIDGLYENGVDDLCIINALPVGTYPRHYSDASIPSKEWEYNGGNHFQLGSFNLPILKQWGRYHACKKILAKSKDKDILIYSPYQPFLKAIKKLDKSYNVTLIVPDLPEFYDYGKVGIIKKILRKINNRSISKCMERVDRFVLLTDEMKNPLAVGKRPYTVVEGICTSRKSEYAREKSRDKKIILYTGALNVRFGTDVLLRAFEQIGGEDYELWICGGGEYSDAVKEAAKGDKRIKFYGYVTADKISELQSKASVLVNPRQNIEVFTKYSFPSKTMEYLMSRVPVVAYKLDGIPDEYDDYINYVEDNTPEALSRVMVSTCEDIDGYYEAKAQRAAEFVSKQKSPEKQAAKILELLKS